MMGTWIRSVGLRLLLLVCLITFVIVGCGQSAELKDTITQVVQSGGTSDLSKASVEVAAYNYIYTYSSSGFFITDELVVTKADFLKDQCYAYLIHVFTEDGTETYPCKVMNASQDGGLLLLKVSGYRCASPMMPQDGQATYYTEFPWERQNTGITGKQVEELLKSDYTGPDYLAYADVLAKSADAVKQLGYQLGLLSRDEDFQMLGAKCEHFGVAFPTSYSEGQIKEVFSLFQTYLLEKQQEVVEKIELDLENFRAKVLLADTDMVIDIAWKPEQEEVLVEFCPGGLTENVMVGQDIEQTFYEAIPDDDAELGRIFADGIGVIRNYDKAMKIWLKVLTDEQISRGSWLKPVDIAYLNFLKKKQFKEDFSFPVNFSFVFLDQDDDPELFMSEGSGTAFPFRMYRYDPVNDEIEYVASFSQQGRLSYLEGDSVIVSSYGNMGHYMTIVSKVSGTTVERLDAVLECGNLNPIQYYGGFPLPDSMQGQYEEDILSKLSNPEEQYEISEEAYEEVFRGLRQKGNYRTLMYDDMMQENIL